MFGKSQAVDKDSPATRLTDSELDQCCGETLYERCTIGKPSMGCESGKEKE